MKVGDIVYQVNFKNGKPTISTVKVIDIKKPWVYVTDLDGIFADYKVNGFYSFHKTKDSAAKIYLRGALWRVDHRNLFEFSTDTLLELLSNAVRLYVAND